MLQDVNENTKEMDWMRKISIQKRAAVGFHFKMKALN
jgi:hypothetical protein